MEGEGQNDKGQLKHQVIGEVQMRPTNLRDEDFGQLEQISVNIEEITELIKPPPIISLTAGKDRNVRQENRVANPEDINRRLIIDSFSEQSYWKIE